MPWIRCLLLLLPITTVFADNTLGRVSVYTKGPHRYITSNGYPDNHGPFPNAHNPNTISAQNYYFRVSLNPRLNHDVTPVGHMDFGVALDGIPFDPNSADYWHHNHDWNYEAMSPLAGLGLDQNHAHVQPDGAYHYHGLPTHLFEQLAPEKVPHQQMVLMGYAADGFPIYGIYGYKQADDSESGLIKLRSSFQLKSGTRSSTSGPGGNYDGRFVEDYHYVSQSGDLDQCNGRQGVTPEYPNGTYYYMITQKFPYLPRCFHGTPDNSFRKKPPPWMRRASATMGAGGSSPYVIDMGQANNAYMGDDQSNNHGYIYINQPPHSHSYSPHNHPYGPHNNPNGPHNNPYGPHNNPNGPHNNPYSPHNNPNGPHNHRQPPEGNPHQTINQGPQNRSPDNGIGSAPVIGGGPVPL